MPANFKRQILSLVAKIPSGQIATYGQLASLAGQPTYWRQVGWLLSQNKNPQIPCHRVIRSNGRVGGYNRGTVEKMRRLRKEGVMVKNVRVDLKFFTPILKGHLVLKWPHAFWLQRR